jgi:hypothetical protein
MNTTDPYVNLHVCDPAGDVGSSAAGTNLGTIGFGGRGRNRPAASIRAVSSIAGVAAYNDAGTLQFFTNGGGTPTSPRMVIDQNGLVGVGTAAPTATFHVVGSTLATAWTTSSDARLKTHIMPLGKGTLQKVMALEAVTYEKKETLESTQYDKKETGFIAQDLRKVFPTMVQENGKDKLLSVNYTELIPVLTKAIQEQQVQIEQLKKENAGLRTETAKVATLESQMSALNAKMELLLKATATPTSVSGGK